MGAGEWIALAGLIIFWLTTMITFWIKIKIKLTEVELQITNTNSRLSEHISWGEKEQIKNLQKFQHIDKDLKENQHQILSKIDTLIKDFGDFRVYSEKNFKK